jgi:hypothetical protein
VKALFVFLISIIVIFSQVQARDYDDWSVIVLREEFGEMEVSRIDSDGTINVLNCEMDNSMSNEAWRLTGVRVRSIGFSRVVDKHMAQLSNAIDGWQTMEWRKEPDPFEDMGNDPPIPVDGPHWRYLLIKWGEGKAWIRTINGSAGIGSKVKTLLGLVGQEIHPETLKSGVVVNDGLLWEPVNNNPPQEVTDASSLSLLKRAGIFIPEPYPKELQDTLSVTDQTSSVEVGGRDFTIWRLSPRGITDEEAERIARRACEGKASLPDDVKVEIVRRDNSIVVTFPIPFDPNVLQGDYHAQITLDANTGKVFFFKGSY